MVAEAIMNFKNQFCIENKGFSTSFFFPFVVSQAEICASHVWFKLDHQRMLDMSRTSYVITVILLWITLETILPIRWFHT